MNGEIWPPRSLSLRLALSPLFLSSQFLLCPVSRFIYVPLPPLSLVSSCPFAWNIPNNKRLFELFALPLMLYLPSFPDSFVSFHLQFRLKIHPVADLPRWIFMGGK